MKKKIDVNRECIRKRKLVLYKSTLAFFLGSRCNT